MKGSGQVQVGELRQGFQQQVKVCRAPGHEEVTDTELPELRRPEDEALLLIHVAVVLVLGVRVGEGSLWLEITGKDLDRVTNVETLHVVRILVDIIQCLGLHWDKLLLRMRRDWPATHRELGAVVNVQLPESVSDDHLEPLVTEGAAPETGALHPLVSEHLHQLVTHNFVYLAGHHEQLLSYLVG